MSRTVQTLSHTTNLPQIAKMNPSSEDITSPEDRNFASDNASVHAWYKELHPKVKKARESVARLIRESSLTQVEKYINDLAQAFARLPPNTSPESRDFGWNLALSCDVDVLQTGWETDDELTEEFIRLVFFHRYPKWAAAKIEPATKLKALKATSHEAAENLLELASSGVPDPQHVKILKDGYNHPYLRNDQIVKPILERLSENAKNWKPNEYLAPYTALIGPSMCGKTRLLMKLSEYVCVIYICLRERGSSGQPPRSVLADEMELDNKNVPKLLEHYYRLLAAIFDVVADFFLSRTAGRDEKQLLLEWSNYNHESGDRLATEVRQRMEEISLQESAALTIFTDKLKKTGKTEYKLPKIPQRGSLIFHGLEQFGCLTPKVSTALEELLSVDPDVRQFHEGNKHTTSFIETTRPCVYKPDTLVKADEGIVIDRAPDDQTL
ncbi:hypothetical protein PtB15_16B102 [Puccinia triticina]|nr:hypothetical protein PtB15_16B102 [Puccinia triticina]